MFPKFLKMKSFFTTEVPNRDVHLFTQVIAYIHVFTQKKDVCTFNSHLARNNCDVVPPALLATATFHSEIALF